MAWRKRFRQRLRNVTCQWQFYRHPPLSWQLTWVIRWEMQKLKLRRVVCFVKGHDRKPRVYSSEGIVFKNMPECKRCYAAPYIDRIEMSELVGR